MFAVKGPVNVYCFIVKIISFSCLFYFAGESCKLHESVVSLLSNKYFFISLSTTHLYEELYANLKIYIEVTRYYRRQFSQYFIIDCSQQALLKLTIEILPPMSFLQKSGLELVVHI